MLAPVLVAVLGLTSACTGGDDPEDLSAATSSIEPSETTSSTVEEEPQETSSSTAETMPQETEDEIPLGETYPLPADLDRAFPESLGSVQEETGQTFDLNGVYRLGEDRVVVTGVLTLQDSRNADYKTGVWLEAGHRAHHAGPRFRVRPVQADR